MVYWTNAERKKLNKFYSDSANYWLKVEESVAVIFSFMHELH